MSARTVLGETATRDGTRVVIYEDTWREHILDPRAGHAELRSHLKAVLATIAAPDHSEDDERQGRQRFYRQNLGPSRWLMVVVSFEQEPARVVTAMGYGHGRSPDGWTP